MSNTRVAEDGKQSQPSMDSTSSLSDSSSSTSSTSSSTSSSSSSSSSSSTATATATATAGSEWLSSPQLLAGGVTRKRRQPQQASLSRPASLHSQLADKLPSTIDNNDEEEEEGAGQLLKKMKQSEASNEEDEAAHPQPTDEQTSRARLFRNVLLLLLFFMSLAALYKVASSFPALKPEERAVIRWPRSYSDVNEIAVVLRRYKTDHFSEVLTAFVALYIFLQAFAIPGAIFLSLLSGPLFGRWYGLGIVSVVATTGASCCFLLSRVLGRHLVERCFPQLLASTRRRIQSHRHNLFFYLLFLRISPLLPNWFISVSSPLLDVPLHIFVAATFFGLIPANYIHVTTGLAVEELAPDQSQGSIKIQWRSLLVLLGIACFALLPTLFKRKLEDVEHRLEDKPLKPVKTA